MTFFNSPRLGESEWLPALELLEEDDLRRLTFDDLRLPPLRRRSVEETDLDRLVERDGLRTFLTGVLKISQN